MYIKLNKLENQVSMHLEVVHVYTDPRFQVNIFKPKVCPRFLLLSHLFPNLCSWFGPSSFNGWLWSHAFSFYTSSNHEDNKCRGEWCKRNTRKEWNCMRTIIGLLCVLIRDKPIVILKSHWQLTLPKGITIWALSRRATPFAAASTFYSGFY